MITKMHFPQEVHLVIQGVPTIYKQGVQEVPTIHKDHWWLKANKVTEVEQTETTIEELDKELDEEIDKTDSKETSVKLSLQSKRAGRR
jgi:hypothetical protein